MPITPRIVVEEDSDAEKGCSDMPDTPADVILEPKGLQVNGSPLLRASSLVCSAPVPGGLSQCDSREIARESAMGVLPATSSAALRTPPADALPADDGTTVVASPFERQHPPRDHAEALMPLTAAQQPDDMQRLLTTLNGRICSIAQSKKSRRGHSDKSHYRGLPCQRVITWLLFHALNIPGAKVLGELIRYTQNHEEWKSYVKDQVTSTIAEPDSGEPMLVTQLARLHAATWASENTPVASLMKWKEHLDQFECLEKLRALLKQPTALVPETRQLLSYLDRTNPGKATYQIKLHRQISKKLGQTSNALYKNHRWGQRLKCLHNTYGPGIMTLFSSSNVMKV